MKIGRLNFSHAVKYDEMTEKLNTFRNVKGAHRRVGIGFNLRGALLDTKGPEIRTGRYVYICLVQYEWMNDKAWMPVAHICTQDVYIADPLMNNGSVFGLYTDTIPHIESKYSFEDGSKSVEIASGAEFILTTDPAFKDKGTAQKVNFQAFSAKCLNLNLNLSPRTHF